MDSGRRPKRGHSDHSRRRAEFLAQLNDPDYYRVLQVDPEAGPEVMQEPTGGWKASTTLASMRRADRVPSRSYKARSIRTGRAAGAEGTGRRCQPAA